MTRAETLRALADRVERGETGREIDLDIWAATKPEKYQRHYWDVRSSLSQSTPANEVEQNTRSRMRAAPLSISIDAQAVLGVRVESIQWDVMGCLASAGEETGRAAAEPAARLAAILRALAAREEAHRTSNLGDHP